MDVSVKQVTMVRSPRPVWPLKTPSLGSPSAEYYAHSDIVGRMYLKRWPIHMHLRAVVVAEPLEVLLGVGPQDGALQFPVYCGIAER